MTRIPYAHQSIDQTDIDAVVEVLRSEWITQGPAIERFERAVADYCGARYGVAVSSGTAGLHIACLAAGLGPGDTLWTSPNSFVASANCALYCGAKVDFVDIDSRTYNLSVDQLEKKLIWAKQNRCLPKVVVPVHFAGQSCEMEEIYRLSQQYGLGIIEDATHALGGRYKGEPVGSCCFSEMAVFSFHPVKMITTGEGGMVLTNRSDLYEKLLRLRNHGITRDKELFKGDSNGSWHYEQLELGFNYRITDIQAALGISQMKRLDDFVERRRLLARRYDKALENLPFTLPWQHPDSESSRHLYVIRIDRRRVQKTHREVFEQLRERGIRVNLHYIPIYTHPYYKKLEFRPTDYPETERYCREAITLPLYYGMTDEEQNRAIGSLVSTLH